MEYRIIRSDELYHYGVRGMRWGHRKAQPMSLAGAGHRALAGVYGINERYYRKNNRNNALASMNAKARNSELKKAATADLKKQQKVNSPEYKARVAKAKKAAKVGAAVGATALAAYGGYKLSEINKRNKMTLTNDKAKAKFVKRSINRYAKTHPGDLEGLLRYRQGIEEGWR